MRTVLATLLAVGFAATSAYAFTAVNGLTVNPVPGGFEVVSQGRDGPRQIWCAAAHYSRVVQGNSNGTRIHILKSYGPSQTHPGRRGVSFTTNPTPALANGPRPGDNGNFSVSLKTIGFNLSTAHAEGFCHDVFDEIDDLWPL